MKKLIAVFLIVMLLMLYGCNSGETTFQMGEATYSVSGGFAGDYKYGSDTTIRYHYDDNLMLMVSLMPLNASSFENNLNEFVDGFVSGSTYYYVDEQTEKVTKDAYGNDCGYFSFRGVNSDTTSNYICGYVVCYNKFNYAFIIGDIGMQSATDDTLALLQQIAGTVKFSESVKATDTPAPQVQE